MLLGQDWHFGATGAEKPVPVYTHAQRWGGGFKASVLQEACLIDRYGNPSDSFCTVG